METQIIAIEKDAGFEQIADHLFKCETCGKIVESGIVNISGHWAECSGKQFAEGLLELMINKGKVTTQDIEKLKNPV